MSLSYSTFILTDDYNILACGDNNSGELGLGDKIDRNTFTRLDYDDIKQLSCGTYHTCILKNDGTLWSCGYNGSSQLGLGDTTTRTVFTKVNISDVKQISCGYDNTFIIKNDGSLWSCGGNNSGQLGLGDTTTRTVFTKVNISDVNYVHCGFLCTCIIKNDGTLWVCGRNTDGQLGLGDKTNRTTFTKVNISDVKQIACGSAFTFILKNDGTLWSCGYNNSGQLGLGNYTTKTTFTKVNISNVEYVSCESYSTIILKNDGTLWATGDNSYGQLGLGDKTNRTTFTEVNISDVKQVSCGFNHNIILKNDGTVWVCGDNRSGQLGLGDTTNRSTFTQADVPNIQYILDEYTIVPELGQSRYELVNIIPSSTITNIDNKYLIKLPYKCRVFKYKLSTSSNIYYTIDNTLDINSDISLWTLDKSYSADTLKTAKLMAPYICRQLLIEADNIDDLEIWAEYDDGSVYIGKITNEKLSGLSNDIRNNLYITEDMYIHINDINGNYFRLNGLYEEVLFEGSISSVENHQLDSEFKYLCIVSTDDTNSYTDFLFTSHSISFTHSSGSMILSMSNNTLNIESISGLTITKIIGLS